jgi:hypothetical protein
MIDKIKYIEGDLFAGVENSKKNIIIPHVVNNRRVWGAGFVIPLGRKYPLAMNEYLSWSNDDILPFELGTQFVKVKEDPIVIVANMLAQGLGENRRPLYYQHLVHCMQQVAGVAIHRNADIVCPLFGSGLAGGDWRFIQELIVDLWIDADIDVTVYYLRNSLPKNWVPPQMKNEVENN